MRGKREVLCDECDFDEATETCADCGMWLCDVCAFDHECDDDEEEGEDEDEEEDEEREKLAAWNARVAEWGDVPRKAQEPMRFTSLFFDFTTGERSVDHWTAATCEDCGAAIAPGTRFCPPSDEAGCTERAFVRNGGAALCAQAAARRAGKEHE